MTNSKSTLIGAGLVGAGCGLTAMGLAVLVPAVANWSRHKLGSGIQKGREKIFDGMESSAGALGTFAGRARRRFEEAAAAARISNTSQS